MTDALAKFMIAKGIITDEEFKTPIKHGAGELPGCAEADALAVQCQRPMKRLFAICGVFLACSATAQSRFPADLERFIERRDICDHFRGEEPYDQERCEFLHQRLLEFCVGTDKQLAELSKNIEATRQ
jgi:hypothetical protein